MEERIREIIDGQKHISEVTMIKGEELQKEGMGLFYAVGKAATSAPRMITVHYKGDPTSDQTHYAIVGKGLTYDTGGLNLKPTGSMEDMHMDKGGAVAAMGALKGALEMQLPVNVAFSFAIAENAIDAKAYKPGDILTSLKGYTVSVGNTDAEGRLVLADTMTWTQRKYKPKYMVDLATLTGACLVALGQSTAGLFTNNEEFLKNYKLAGDSVYEDHWHLPINEEHSEIMKADIANLDNSGAGRYGGASTAAAFLQNFVEKDTKWIHCDLAGPAYLKKPFFPMPSHGTGFGVQTLLKLLRDHKE
jgi:leucyl aminopeptidase